MTGYPYKKRKFGHTLCMKTQGEEATHKPRREATEKMSSVNTSAFQNFEKVFCNLSHSVCDNFLRHL